MHFVLFFKNTSRASLHSIQIWERNKQRSKLLSQITCGLHSQQGERFYSKVAYVKMRCVENEIIKKGVGSSLKLERGWRGGAVATNLGERLTEKAGHRIASSPTETPIQLLYNQ